ncbi:hypothetical protein PG993_009932 [Apiospora rasikravindrae]|uniref:Transmembrane protein n=1 Tax=Apiospora rasikravindrae TaxID=990691 RepID=A0ABR1SKS8_9PEZI
MLALTQGQQVPPETAGAPMTIAGFNTVLLSVAATLCGLFAVVTLSVRQIRCEARQCLLRALRFVGFAFAYLVIGLVYVPIRILDFVSRAWPSSCASPYPDDYEDDEDGGCGGGSISISSSKTWLDQKRGGDGDDNGGMYGYEDEFCRTHQDVLAAGSGREGGGGRHYPAAADSGKYTRSNSDISALDLNEARDLEKGVTSPWRNKTKPC